MENARRNIIYATTALVVVALVLLFLNPGFRDLLTGRASTSQPSNVSVTVTGTQAVSIVIFNQTLTGSTVDPIENNESDIEFFVVIDDQDGVNDINDSSVSVNFTRTSEPVRQNSSCSLVSDLNTTAANYSCTVGMWYFDENGIWNITVEANDLGNTSYQQQIKTFQFNQLQAIVLSPNALTFPEVAPNAENQTSDNDPTLINNTGNYDVSSPNLRVLGIDLLGETDSSQSIPVANFTADIDTGGSPAAECDGTALVNNSAEGIVGASLSRGNNSVNDGSTGQEQLYYCIIHVPQNIQSQAYSTLNGGSWTVSIV